MLGEQIKSLRLAKGINQVELAKDLGVSKQTVSNWENNNILPSVELLITIAKYFSCTTDYLLELDVRHQNIDVSELTLEQASHIQQLVNDLKNLNQKSKRNDYT